MNLLNIDLTDYMNEQEQPIISVNVLTLAGDIETWKQPLESYRQYPRHDYEHHQGRILRIMRRKIVLMNYYLCTNKSHKFFINRILDSVLAEVLFMAKYELKDPLYTELQSRFTMLVAAIQYLIGLEQPDQQVLRVICDSNTFERIIYGLKFLNLMRLINRNTLRVDYPKLLTELEVKQIQSTVLYKVVCMGKSTELPDRLSSLQNLSFKKEDYSHTGMIEVPLMKSIFWEILYETPLCLSIKEQLYKDIQQYKTQ